MGVKVRKPKGHISWCVVINHQGQRKTKAVGSREAAERVKRLVTAFAEGKCDISDEFVFPSEAGTPIEMNNFIQRVFRPLLTHAGLRKIRFDDLRHTFGSLLIQTGASLAYVREQMGHSSIQVTVDLYGHLIPGANISFVDRLDGLTSARQSAIQPQYGAGK